MLPRIYTYKITFEEIPDWYWGVHKERKFGEHYMGSPVTHKWKWEFYTPKIQLLEVFENSQEGWEVAKSVEKRLITPDLENPLCLNEGCAGIYSFHSLSEGGKKGGRKSAELGYLDTNSQNSIKTLESLSLAGKKGGAATRDSGKLRETSRKGGRVQGPRNKGMSWYYRFLEDGRIVYKRSKTPLPHPWLKGRNRVKPVNAL